MMAAEEEMRLWQCIQCLSLRPLQDSSLDCDCGGEFSPMPPEVEEVALRQIAISMERRLMASLKERNEELTPEEREALAKFKREQGIE